MASIPPNESSPTMKSTRRLFIFNSPTVALATDSNPSEPASSRISQSISLFSSLLLSILLGTAALTASAGTSDTFKGSNTDLTSASGYNTGSLPGSTTDVKLTTSGTALTDANVALTMESLTAAPASNTTLTISGTNGQITLGNSVGFTNSNNSTLNDLIALTGTKSLTITGNGGTKGLVLASSGNFNNASTASTGLSIASNISQVISGTSLTMTGVGTTSLTGTNTFSGGLMILAGETDVTGDSSLGAAGGSVTINGGRLGFATNSMTIDATRNILLGSNPTGSNTSSTLSVKGSITVAYNGAFQNLNGSTTGDLVKQGGGTLQLGGVNTYSGSTFLNNGITQLTTGNDRLPTSTVVNMGQAASANLATLDLNGNNQTIAGLVSTAGTNATATTNVVTSTTAATLTVNTSGSNSYTYSAGTQAASGVISGAVSLVKTGTGTQTLGGASSYTGTTQVNGGTLNVAGSITGTGAMTLSNSGSTLATGSATTIGGSITANSGTAITVGGAGTVGTLTSGALTVNNGAALNFDILNNSNYDKINTTGVLTLGSGTETVNVAGSGFTAGNSFTLVSGYSSVTGGAFTLGSTPAGFNYSLSTGGSSTVLSVSALGGSGNVTWSTTGLSPTSGTDGAGTWTNGSTNFYNTGTSAQTTWDNTASYNLTVGSSGTGGTITLGGNVTVGGALTLAPVSSPYTLGTAGGTNTLTLAGGITANNSATINAPTVLSNSQAWNVTTGTLTASGAISETGGARQLSKSGSGTLVLASASNSYSGGTILGGGIVRVSSDANLGNAAGGLTFAGGTLQTSAGITSARGVNLSSGGGVFDSNGSDSTLSGQISGTGALSKNGSGTLTISNTGNNYSGGTTVNGGALSIASGSSAGTSASAMTVNSGATLTGSGTVNGTTSVNSGTINGTGLKLTGAVTFNGAGNNVNGTVTSANGTVLTAGSTAAVNGTLTGTGSAVTFTTTGNNATLTNLGTINQTGTGRAVRDNTGVTGLVINNGSTTNSAALIQTADADAVQMNVSSGSVTVNNYGSIISKNASAGGAQALDFNAVTTGSNTINNYATGYIAATNADAVRPGVNGVVNNDGYILSTGDVIGIGAKNNTGVVINNTGTIEGGHHAITGGALDSTTPYTTTVTNSVGGLIQGDNGSGINLDGFNANQTATIINHGTITGYGGYLSDGSPEDGDGVDVDGLVNVTNTGIIRSLNASSTTPGAPAHSEGITVGGGTITNSGTIEGLVASGNTNAIGYGITLLGNDITTGPLTGGREPMYGNATVNNLSGGLIRGDSASGIAVLGSTASGYAVTINNNAGATIQGGATLSGLGNTQAAIFTGEDPVTLNNAGKIDGSSNGYAITGDTGNITLNVTGGSALILGAITGGSGTNVMHIDPGAGNTFSYAGAISNFSTVEVKSGTVALSGASSSYSGTTTLTAGQLSLNNAAAIGTGTLVINGGVLDNTTGSALTLSTNNALSINSNFEFKGSSDLNLGTGAVTLDANHVVTVDAGKLTIGGAFTSSQYQLTKAGAGTLVLSGANSFSGPVTVSGGALSTSNVASLGAGTQVNLSSGSSLQYTGTSATITQDITVTSGTGSIQNTGGGTLTLSGNLSKNGTVLTLSGGVINANGSITGSSAGSDLVVDAATVNENAANTYNGPTYIRNAGTLNANVASALPTANGRTSVILDDTGSGGSKLALGADQSAAALTGAASSTVDLGGHTLTVGSTSGTTTYNGVITSSSGGILVKDGGSTLILAGASTYDGGTQINAGSLSVTNTTGSATGSGSVMVNSGGALNGTGTVGPVAVASGGTIAPGLDVGALNVNGTLDLVGGSHLDYNLGSSSSLLNVSGALNYTGGGAAIFDIANTGSMTSGTDYTLINYASESGLSLANLAFGSTPSVFSGHFVIGANSLTLHVDSVPEPSRALLGALGLAFIALRRRRRVRAAY